MSPLLKRLNRCGGVKRSETMYKGIHIGINGSFIENFVQNSGELKLLGKGDGSEVMLQRIKANETVIIEPGDNIELMEFFYILEGELELDDNQSKTTLKRGDYFYSHCLYEHVQFETKSQVSLLYFSTQPVFNFLSTTINELVELANTVEKKDYYTHDHIQRVKNYGIMIGNKLRLSKEKIENIAFAALFHDLGKINVPDYVLNKPDRLTDEEFGLIKKHSAWGAELVSKTYFENLSKIIRQHHEKIDGSGYPDGLKSDEILIEAKIIGVADAYDAMTSNRSYRKALNPQDAVDELLRFKDKHYDAEIVDALIEVLKEGNII